MRTTSQDIEKQAAEWVAKRELGDLSPKEQAAFDAWLAADVRALGAYCRIEGALVRLGRVGRAARDGDDAPGPREEPATGIVKRYLSRRVILSGSVAAGFAAVCTIGASMWMRRQQNSFVSGVGLVREVPLSDGSVITLNTNSEVSVNYTDAVREIHLLRGEALFDVAKNKKRPFIVFAAGTQVRAVGTSFSVSMLPQRPVQVLVKEGVVELKPAAGDRVSAVRVKANTRVLIPERDRFIAVNIAQEKVDRDLAWQHGELAFDNQTLREAAQEYARYSSIRIVVDEASADRTVTGSFAANDPIGFAKLTAEALDLQVEVNDNEVRLLSRPQKKL
jgi:transmembrane sensor